MPILKRVVNITETGEDEYEVTDSYGQHKTTFTVDQDISIATLLVQRLNLRPGDRVEVNFLDQENPTARIGKARPARPDRPRTGGPKRKPQEE
jgi:hypothetical protein